MGLSAADLNAGVDALAAREPAFAAALARVGYPAPRIRTRGYATLLRTIVGQLEKLPDLIERETKLARTPDEAEAVEVARLICTVVAIGTRGCGQETVLLVEPDRLDLGPRSSSQLADHQNSVVHLLTL